MKIKKKIIKKGKVHYFHLKLNLNDSDIHLLCNIQITRPDLTGRNSVNTIVLWSVKCLTNTYCCYISKIHISINQFADFVFFFSISSWFRKLFFLCVTPNILNGFHVSSYVFLGQPPKDHWCNIYELRNSTFSDSQMRNISST